MDPIARKNQLLDCAAELLVEAGIEALTMEGLAARAGVNKALPYYYFKSREGVLLDLYEREYARWVSQITEAVEAATDLEAKLRAVVGIWLDTADQQNVLSVLDTVRTDSGVLEAAQVRHQLEAGQFFAELFGAAYGLDREEAIVTAAVTLASSQGLIPAWRFTGWSRERVTDFFIAMCFGLLEGARQAHEAASRPKAKKRAARR